MPKKRVLLLNPPGDKLYSRDKYCSSVSKADYYWAPIDLLVLSGMLGEKYCLKIIDAIIEKKDDRRVREEIRAFGPEVIVSLISDATWRIDLKFLKTAKDATGCRIVVSGGIALSKSRHILEYYPFVDACLMDFTSQEIIKYIENDDSVLTMTYRKGDSIVDARMAAGNTFSYAVPKHELFPINRYRYPIGIYHPSTCLISSLGCPYRCTFCVPSTIPYKSRDISNVVEELKHIASLGIREVVFQDSTFSADREHAKLLCERMLSEKTGLSWICLTRVDCVDEELLLLMKKAGCHTIEFGVEAGDDTTLKRLSKGITRKNVLDAFAACRRAGIRTCAFFIIGLPGQDADSVRKMIDFAVEIDPDAASFSFAMPLAGTKIADDLMDGDKQLPEINDVEISIPVNSRIDTDELISLRNLAYRKFYFRPRYILRQLFSLRTFCQFRLMTMEFMALLRKYV